MSQDALAERLGVTFQQVQKYERGLNRISVSRLFEVAQALDTPVHDLLQGLAPGAPQTEPEPYTAQVAAAARLRRLTRAYESLSSEGEREKLVKAAEVIARRDTGGEFSP
jgi:transcriptional regulator with XRE-family HTH domain